MSFGERFLHYPDLFPARRAGERWGEHALSLDLPGGPYTFSGMAARQHEAVAERYSRYLTAGPGGGFTCEVFAVDRRDFREIDTRGWEYTLDIDATDSSVRFAGIQLMSRFDWAPSPVAALWTGEDRPDYFVGVLENVFRPAVAYQVASRGGLMIHSSGALVGDKAVLFAGRSGAGKSTVASLALEHGLQILSDDLNIVRRVDDRWMARALPFSGDHRADASLEDHELSTILRLQQGNEDALTEMSSAEAWALIVGCCPYVNIDEFRRNLVIDTVEELVSAVEVGCLTFRKDPGFWPIIESR